MAPSREETQIFRLKSGDLVGAARNADLWDFCGARRRPSPALAAGHTGTSGSGEGSRLGPRGWQLGLTGLLYRVERGGSWLGPPVGQVPAGPLARRAHPG